MKNSIYVDYAKVRDTILSCKTHIQHLGANELVKLFKVKWGGHHPRSNDAFASGFKICDRSLHNYIHKQWMEILRNNVER